MLNELVELRSDLYSKHYLKKDGKNTVIVHPEAVHYRDEQGLYQDIELSIEPKQNWEFDFASTKNNTKSYFLDTKDSENPLLAGVESFDAEGKSRWLNLKPVGLCVETDVRTTIEDNEIVFDNFHPSVSIQYDVLPNRLKESIIIDSPLERYKFTFTLKMGGVELEQQGGEIYFVDSETQERVWELEPIFAEDSNGVQSYGFVTSVHPYEYKGQEFQAISIELVDKAFLEDAVFPIVIDPTVTQPNRPSEYSFNINIPTGDIVTSARGRFRGVTTNINNSHGTFYSDYPSGDYVDMTATFPNTYANLPSDAIYTRKEDIIHAEMERFGPSLTATSTTRQGYAGGRISVGASEDYDDWDGYIVYMWMSVNGHDEGSTTERSYGLERIRLTLSTVITSLATYGASLTGPYSTILHPSPLANGTYGGWFDLASNLSPGSNSFRVGTLWGSRVTVEIEYETVTPALRVRSDNSWVVPSSVVAREGSDWVTGRAVQVYTGSGWERVL